MDGLGDAWIADRRPIILIVFVTIERRSTHPLLPLRIVLDRNRGGSYLSVLISGAGLFGVFLFLTYYLQKTLGYSPVATASRSCRWWR